MRNTNSFTSLRFPNSVVEPEIPSSGPSVSDFPQLRPPCIDLPPRGLSRSKWTRTSRQPNSKLPSCDYPILIAVRSLTGLTEFFSLYVSAQYGMILWHFPPFPVLPYLWLLYIFPLISHAAIARPALQKVHYWPSRHECMTDDIVRFPSHI